MEAAGLASSILTFIDISFKIVKGANELYKSASGSTSENDHIANVVLDLEKASGYLSIAQSGNNDPGFQSLLVQCQSLSCDLLELLYKLRVKDKTLFKSFAAAFANARKQKDIASIEHRLDQYRQQILLRLSLLFWHVSKSSTDSRAARGDPTTKQPIRE
ncbi:Vegetative incompatibility protein HET-E-1 [Colletotrichum asianum]